MPKNLSRHKVTLKADLSRRKVTLKADKALSSTKKTAIFLPMLMFFLTIAGVIWVTQKLLKNPTQTAKVEVKEMVEKVEKLIELPKDETPTIATVSDLSKLKNQSFFANAKKYDKIFIYTKAKKAYLYRPSENKIIEVAAINLNKGK